MSDTDRLTAITERAHPSYDWMQMMPPHYAKGSIRIQDVMASQMAQDIPWLLEQLSASAARIARLEAENEQRREMLEEWYALWVDSDLPAKLDNALHVRTALTVELGERKEQHG